MTDSEIVKQFSRDVRDHLMDVRLDQGVYRDVRFNRPGTWSYGFNLTTWPGFLCISGDMGSYVFTRLADMFEFFRRDRPGINLYYWTQKIEAIDRNGPLKEFSPALFRAAVLQEIKERRPPKAIRDAIRSEVLECAEDEESAMHAAYNFECDGFRFDDFYEYTLHQPSYRLIWCCHAIAWGIQQYDASKSRLLEIAS